MSYGKHVVLWDFILAVWWRPARERRPTCKFPTFIFLNFPYSLRTYSLPAPQGCQSAQTLHYITLHYIILLYYHGILQLARIYVIYIAAIGVCGVLLLYPRLFHIWKVFSNFWKFT